MLAVFLAGVAVAVNRFKVPPVLPTLMAELDVGLVTGGWLMSITSLSSFVLAIPVALVLARVGLKAAGLLAMCCTVLGSAIGALATNSAAMLAGRVIEGISASLIAVVAPTAISLWFEPRERGLPMGIWATWVPVGNVIMFNMAHPLIEAFGWRALWWAGALVALAAGVLVGVLVRNPSQEDTAPDRSSMAPAAHLRRLANPTTWLLALSFGAFGFCILGYNTWAPTYLVETLDIGAATASSYASLMFLAAIPANVFAGWLLNQMQDRYRGLPLLFLATSLLLVWSLRLPSAAIVVPYMLLLGLVSNFVPTFIFTLAPETMPGDLSAGLALATVMAVSNLGALAGPPSIGAILSQGTWATASSSLAVVMAMGALFAWLVRRKQKQSPALS
jgi:predicted MFS family arabinose efflux permease